MSSRGLRCFLLIPPPCSELGSDNGCKDDATAQQLDRTHPLSKDDSTRNGSEDRFQAKDKSRIRWRRTALTHCLEGETERRGEKSGVKQGEQADLDRRDRDWLCYGTHSQVE